MKHHIESRPTLWSNISGETPPSRTGSSGRDAHTAVLFSPSCNGLATLDARQKLLI